MIHIRHLPKISPVPFRATILQKPTLAPSKMARSLCSRPVRYTSTSIPAEFACVSDEIPTVAYSGSWICTYYKRSRTIRITSCSSIRSHDPHDTEQLTVYITAGTTKLLSFQSSPAKAFCTTILAISPLI